jgi:lysophospholipase L1-like esterase
MLFCGILLALLVFEIGFRVWLRVAPKTVQRNDRPEIYYAPAGSASPSDFTYSREKPPHTFRIAAIGDSFTFPTYMHFDDAFPKRLERMLNLSPDDEHPLRAEVMNFGHMGASTLSEVPILRHALDYHPDLVIIEVTLNDPEPRNLHQEREKHPEKYDFGSMVIDEHHHPLLNHWKSMGFLIQRIHNSRSLDAVINYYRDMYNPDGRWKVFTEAFQQLKQKADEHHVKLVAMIFPMFYTPLDDQYPFQDVHQQIAAYLNSIGVMNLDLLPAFRGLRPERLVVINGGDTHPNEIAHRVAADALYDWLETEDLLPEQLRIKDRYSRRGLRPHRVQDELTGGSEESPENVAP